MTEWTKVDKNKVLQLFLANIALGVIICADMIVFQAMTAWIPVWNRLNELNSILAFLLLLFSVTIFILSGALILGVYAIDWHLWKYGIKKVET